jgi:hypothetical protein
VSNIPHYLQKKFHIFWRCPGIFPKFLKTSMLFGNGFKNYKILNGPDSTRPDPLSPKPTRIASDPLVSDWAVSTPIPYRPAPVPTRTTSASSIGRPPLPCPSTPFCVVPVTRTRSPTMCPVVPLVACHGASPAPSTPRASEQASPDWHGLQPDTASRSPNPCRPRLPCVHLVATTAVSTAHSAPSCIRSPLCHPRVRAYLGTPSPLHFVHATTAIFSPW